MKKADGLLVISRGAGGLDDQAEAGMRSEFAGYSVVDFDPKLDVAGLVEPQAPVVVAGGDGTVEAVVRRLADTDHPVGIIPVGTFNNFARALGLPADLDEAMRVVKSGRPRAITLGRVNGHVFLEACAIGMFGDALVLGEGAKDREFGTVAQKMNEVIAARPFEYELSGDLESKGSAKSLVFSNTSSIGSQLPVSHATPIEPYLEFAADAGQSVPEIVGRALASAILDVHEAKGFGRLYRFRSVGVRTSPRVRVYADNHSVGRTPATVTADASALRVFLPVR
jgi:diacylglycerol kinase family enzyme